mmetsp:Transcript_110510/g.174094  ORF Transcript_110510/g.174094 Transcript_110510/m.174094 type:complete len:311 (-) Transcript_110510:2361-3293(-)
MSCHMLLLNSHNAICKNSSTQCSPPSRINEAARVFECILFVPRVFPSASSRARPDKDAREGVGILAIVSGAGTNASPWLRGLAIRFAFPNDLIATARSAPSAAALGFPFGAFISRGGDHSGILTPFASNSITSAFSAFTASERGFNRFPCSCVSLSPRHCSAAAMGERASASAPSAMAAFTRSAAPAGALLTAAAKESGICAQGARAGLVTQTWRQHRQSLRSISLGSLMRTNSNIFGQEKPRSNWKLCTSVGVLTARRQSPLSITASTARQSMASPCLPGCFAKMLKNTIISVACVFNFDSQNSSDTSF